MENTPYLEHHGIKGQKWGIRRFQNYDGTLTAEGRARYGVGKDGSIDEKGKKKLVKDLLMDNKNYRAGYDQVVKKDPTVRKKIEELAPYADARKEAERKVQETFEEFRNDKELQKEWLEKFVDNVTEYADTKKYLELLRAFKDDPEAQELANSMEAAMPEYRQSVLDHYSQTDPTAGGYYWLQETHRDVYDAQCTARANSRNASLEAAKSLIGDHPKLPGNLSYPLKSEGLVAIFASLLEDSAMKEHKKGHLAHYGILGQKWGIRRFQNEDGTWTEEGKARYGDGTDEPEEPKETPRADWKDTDRQALSDEELKRRIARLQQEATYQRLMSELDHEEIKKKKDHPIFRQVIVSSATTALAEVVKALVTDAAKTKVAQYVSKDPERLAKYKKSQEAKNLIFPKKK